MTEARYEPRWPAVSSWSFRERDVMRMVSQIGYFSAVVTGHYLKLEWSTSPGAFPRCPPAFTMRLTPCELRP